MGSIFFWFSVKVKVFFGVVQKDPTLVIPVCGFGKSTPWAREADSELKALPHFETVQPGALCRTENKLQKLFNHQLRYEIKMGMLTLHSFSPNFNY